MKTTLYFALLLFSANVLAQNESDHWMFGSNGGINFTSGSPAPEAGCMLGTGEGSSSFSDATTGNMLFYTDGMSVYDASHTLMPNGSGLLGNSSSTQSALIVPKPGSSTLYYIFTTDCLENSGAFGCAYSVVDMTLNGGMGDVVATEKNVVMFSPNSEQLSATKHANCVDWWIMTKELNNNVYRAYLLTSTGLSAPVVSTLGLPTGTLSYGQGKFSPDGTKYAISTGFFDGINFSALTQLFDFDYNTGLLSNPVPLVNLTGEDSYGLSFSGDNSKLYVMRGSAASSLYQYDISSGVAATMIASATYLGDCGSYNQMQLAKDFKIYISNSGFSNLSVVNNPNVAGTGCGLSVGSVLISGFCTLGVCNFPDSYFNETSPCSPTMYINTDGTNITCNGANDGMAVVQVYNNSGPYTISWSPGGSTNDTITNLGPGTYTVTVTDSSGTVVTENVVIVNPTPLTANITGNDTICSGSVTLAANAAGGTPGYSYQWSTSAGDILSTVTFTPTVTTTVTVNIEDANGCTTSDAFTVVVLPALQVVAPEDTCICSGYSLVLTASGTPTYNWSTGHTTPSIVVTPTSDTSFIVTYNISSTCSTDDTVNICVYPSPVLFTDGDTVVEAGVPVDLLAVGTGAFYWSPSTGLSCTTCSNPTATIFETTLYTVTLTAANGCITTGTVLVELAPVSWIPNIITPNGDGLNDVFKISGLPPSSTLHIFNRWGNEVFVTDNYLNDWKGTVDGVYYYVLQTPDSKTFSGFVHVTGN